MSGIDPRAAAGGAVLIVAFLIAFSTFDSAMRGEITIGEAEPGLSSR